MIVRIDRTLSALPFIAPPSVLPDISPTRGEIGLHIRVRQSSISQVGETNSGRPISPLVGEMSGRTEGGAVGRRPRRYTARKRACHA